MVKKRKTRSQKIAADLRHQDLSLKASPSYSLSTPLPEADSKKSIERPIQTQPSVSAEYRYVRHDLLKTSSITGAIIIAELVLFFFVG